MADPAALIAASSGPRQVQAALVIVRSACPASSWIQQYPTETIQPASEV
jgi:hypothetical protein